MPGEGADPRGGEECRPTASPTVICRCEEITEDQIIAAYHEGYRTVDEIKRKLRCGMGPCQGRTCSQLVLSLLSRLSGKSQAELAPAITRPPLKPTELAAFRPLAKGSGDEQSGDGDPE